MHGLAVYVKEGPPFAWDLSLESSEDSYLCFRLALLHSVTYFFSSVDHLLHRYIQFLILFHLQPSQLPTAKGNYLRYCHQRENHWQQTFAIDHLFTIHYEPFSVLLNKIFSFIQMFTLSRKDSSPDYFTWSISFPFILDFNTLQWSEWYCRF